MKLVIILLAISLMGCAPKRYLTVEQDKAVWELCGNTGCMCLPLEAI